MPLKHSFILFSLSLKGDLFDNSTLFSCHQHSIFAQVLNKDDFSANCRSNHQNIPLKFSIIKITYVIIHPPPKTTPYVFFCISFLLSWLKFSLWFILKTFSAAVKIWWYKYSCGLFFNALFQFLTAFFFLLKIFFSSLIFFSFKLIELF